MPDSVASYSESLARQHSVSKINRDIEILRLQENIGPLD